MQDQDDSHYLNHSKVSNNIGYHPVSAAAPSAPSFQALEAAHRMRWTSEIRITTPGVSEAPHCPLCAALSSLLHNTDSWARRDIAAGEELLEDYGVRAAHLSRFAFCLFAQLQSR